MYVIAQDRPISKKNRAERREYGVDNRPQDFWSFWQYVSFSDKAYYNPDEQLKQRILREAGSRLDADNIQVRPELQGVRVHFSASCLWHHKSDLTFYNDEHDPPIVKPVLPPKPRRRPKTETPEQYK